MAIDKDTISSTKANSIYLLYVYSLVDAFASKFPAGKRCCKRDAPRGLDLKAG